MAIGHDCQWALWQIKHDSDHDLGVLDQPQCLINGPKVGRQHLLTMDVAGSIIIKVSKILAKSLNSNPYEW